MLRRSLSVVVAVLLVAGPAAAETTTTTTPTTTSAPAPAVNDSGPLGAADVDWWRTELDAALERAAELSEQVRVERLELDRITRERDDVSAKEMAAATEVATMRSRVAELASAAYVTGGPAAQKASSTMAVIADDSAVSSAANAMVLPRSPAREFTDTAERFTVLRDELSTQAAKLLSELNEHTSTLRSLERDLAGTEARAAELFTGLVAAQEARAELIAAAADRAGVPDELRVYGNGQIPLDKLVPIGIGSHRLFAPAALQFIAMRSAAASAGVEIGVTDSYRSYAAQVDVAARKGLYSQGGWAAFPGTSDHGWGLAVDIDVDAAGLQWMRANAASFGFVEDTPREPWHWGYHGLDAPTPAS